MNIALTIFYSLSFTIFVVGLLTLVYYPLSLAFALRKEQAPILEDARIVTRDTNTYPPKVDAFLSRSCF